MLELNFQKGYIALFSTIILSAVFLLLFMGMFVIATGGMSRTSDQEGHLRSFSLAETCKEEALASLRIDPDSIIENITIGDIGNRCYIDEVERHSNSLLSFVSIGEYDDYKKIIQIDLEIQENEGLRFLNIIGWDDHVD